MPRTRMRRMRMRRGRCRRSGWPPERRGTEMFDYLIVGAGFAGSVLAERLASQRGQEGAGRRQAPPHRRQRLRPATTTTGVLIHKYGPHIFHTNSAEVFEYLSPFTAWRPYQHRVLAPASTASWCRCRSTWTPSTGCTACRCTSFELEEFFQSVAEPRDRDPHLRGRGGEPRRPRAVREVLPELHAQAVGARPVGARRGRHRARARCAPTATTATSPTASRRCRCTATRACSSACSTTRTSRSC